MSSAPGKKKKRKTNKEINAFYVNKDTIFGQQNVNTSAAFVEEASTTKAVSVISNIHGRENRKTDKEVRTETEQEEEEEQNQWKGTKEKENQPQV